MISSSNNTRIITLTILDNSTSSVELSTGTVDTKELESLNLHFSTAKLFPNTNGYLDHLWPQTRHPCWAYSLVARSTGSKLLHTLDKGMMPTHFHMQGQPWQFHNTSSSLHGEQPQSTMFSLTTKLAYHSKYMRQQQKTLPQYITHNMIIHQH